MNFRIAAFADEADGQLANQIEAMHRNRISLLEIRNVNGTNVADLTPAQAREIRDKVVCIIDDNPNKWHRYLNGIPIIGGRDEIMRAVEEYRVDEIFLAIPGASVQQPSRHTTVTWSLSP